jgi:hypothetical protein
MRRIRVLGAIVIPAMGLTVMGIASYPTEPSLVVGDEVRVSHDGDFDHWELMAAVDPERPERVLISAITEDLPGTGAWTVGAYLSTDGGASWSRTFRGEERLGDPIVAYGPAGQAYLALLQWGSGQRLIGVYRSDDGGATWSTPRTAIAGDGMQADHPMIAIDWTGGAQHGAIFIAARYGNDPILLHRSTDGGRSFDSRVVVSDSDGGFVDPMAVFSDGAVLIPFRTRPEIHTDPETRRYAGSSSRHFVVVAEDGGSRITPPQHLFDRMRTTGRGGTNTVTTGIGRHDGRDRIYVTHNMADSADARLRIIHSDDRGVTWSEGVEVAPGFAPEYVTGMSNVAVSPEGAVGVSWLAYVDRHYDVFFTASVDGGVTFLPPVRVNEEAWIPPSQTARGPGGDYMLMAAGPDDTFHVVWPDARHGRYQIYTRRVRVER